MADTRMVPRQARGSEPWLVMIGSGRDGWYGFRRLARTLVAGLRTATRAGGFTLRREEVNGQPGALFFDHEDRVAGVMILDVANGQVHGVSSIVNPDNLRHLGPVADLRALLRERS